MTIAHYIHRLPADYDIGLIRSRAKERGALWNDVPELHFKGFLLRERGRFGAIASSYSSLYLWRTDEAFRNFLVSGRYKVVTDSFGRADIQTRFALDARRGRADDARFITKQELSIPLDADLTAAFASEIARNREVAEQQGTVAAIIGVDPQTWTFTRILVSEQEPTRESDAAAYEVLHLARPLLDSLPSAGSR
ncbi:DUF4865 family protein [Bradyrhizobium sp. CIAT3101]|uniref:DUF4865 family protein n=1 Tax=Bradyrhizobium sp. CIAT3101 TaxID=439387 RepID=UPI0024B0BB7C|nr:DUF4865 family protein [Bradyrhizobium sp. CIAT3101]WFU78153.1 DUF4865 family protein [Bradyrhizobium sp. CIAT3101]